MFNGGYAQLAYTLTGENRAYDKRMGALARDYYGPQGPTSVAQIVRDENGCINWSTGAWELAARFGYVDLNSGAGANGIRGGEMQTFTFGLNWYLNTNLNMMIDYIHDFRYDVPTGGTLATSTIPGSEDGIGCSLQFKY
jgi:phosphate-selective porin OprO/OprP